MFHRTHTWAYLALILVVVLLSLSVVSAQDVKPEAVGLRPDAPQYALHGPYWVGTMQLEAETDLHPTTVLLWYPALNPDGLEEKVTYDWKGITVTGHALANAPPDTTGGPFPLIIFAYGNNAAPNVYNYLLEHLASQGFVAMAIEYGDSFVNPLLAEDFSSTFTRLRDIAWQIDYANKVNAKDGVLPSMIDTEKIAVMGHSFGGETALQAGGAALNLGKGSWCDLNPHTLAPPESGAIELCIRAYPGSDQALVKTAGLTSVPEGLWPVWGDARVDAIVPMSPGLQDFGPDSFASVKIPMMLMVGASDPEVHSNWPIYQQYAFDAIASPQKSIIQFAEGGHPLFVDKCDDMPWVYELGVAHYCSDPVWDMDRAHDLTNHFTTAFLLDVLKGDKDAHAALAPDAVSFTGIEYQTEGY